MGQDNAAEFWYFQRVFGAFFVHIGDAEERQRRRLARWVLPVAFNGRDFGGLMLKRIQPVHIANHRLNGGDYQRHPQRHRKHAANRGCIVAAQQMPGGRRADKKRAA